MKPFRHEIRVPFYDIDLMRVVWHGHYVKYFEEARCAFFESLGMSYLDMEKAGFLLPVVSLEIKYIRPAVFRQRIGVDVAPDPDFENLLKLRYTVVDIETGEKLCKGVTRQAAVDRETRSLRFLLPGPFVRRLREAIR